MKRDEVVDAAKGLGILFVILGHLVYNHSVASKFLFAFHMPLFYLLMGLIFPYTLSLKKYLHKSRKLLLSYFLFLLIGVLITFAVPALREAFVFDETAKRYLFCKFQPECFNVGQIWFFINALVVITLYFLFSKLALPGKKIETKKKETILAATALMIGFAGILIFNKTNNAFYIPVLNITTFMRPALKIPPLPLKLDTAICAFLFFYIGVLLNKSNFKFRIYSLKTGYKIGGFFLFGIIAFGVSVLNESVNICGCYFGNPILFLAGSLSGILMTILAASLLKKGKIRSFLSYVGQNSLLIFAIHSFPIMIYAAVISAIFHQNYKGMLMPFPFAIIGLPVVLLMTLPFVAATRFVQKYLAERKASESNGK